MRSLEQHAEGVLLGVAALAALVFQLTLPARFPSEASHVAAAAHVSQNAQSGDVVLLQPWWTERARAFIPENVPVTGYLGSDDEALENAPRIWLLSHSRLPFSGDVDFHTHFDPGRKLLSGPVRFGPLSLSLYGNARARVTRFDAAAALASAEAAIVAPDGTQTSCVHTGSAFQCPPPVGPITLLWREVAFAPHRCIVVRPPGGAHRLALTFRAPTSLGAHPRIRLRAGLTWDRGWKHDAAQTPVHLGLDDASGNALRIELPVGVEGFRESIGNAPQGPFRVWIQSENPRDRETCLDVRILAEEAHP